MQLLALRTAAGWSQEYVARHMEVSRATYNNWEKGRTEPNYSAAKKLAELFGVKMEDLKK